MTILKIILYCYLLLALFSLLLAIEDDDVVFELLLLLGVEFCAGSPISKCLSKRYNATASLMRLKTTQNVSISINSS